MAVANYLHLSVLCSFFKETLALPKSEPSVDLTAVPFIPSVEKFALLKASLTASP